jgi:Zn-dependent membrane protease YugP
VDSRPQLDDMERRMQLYDEHRRQVWDAIKSSTDSLDRNILTLSTGGLGLSLAFIKDVVHVGKAAWLPVLFASWILFGIAIVVTLVSFPISIKAHNQRLDHLAEYYLKRRDEFFNKPTRYLKALSACTAVASTSFVLALLCTITFACKNLVRIHG